MAVLNASASGPVNLTYASLEGYVAGRLVLAEMDQFKELTSTGLTSGLYRMGLIDLDDVQIGTFTPSTHKNIFFFF